MLTLQQVEQINSWNFESIPKKVLVELHNIWLLRYKKLTQENYGFRWCEVENIKETKPQKNVFTFDPNDMEITNKLKTYHRVVKLTGNTCMNAFLNLRCAMNDGLWMSEQVFKTRYWTCKRQQLSLF